MGAHRRFPKRDHQAEDDQVILLTLTAPGGPEGRKAIDGGVSPR